ncbi:ribosome maturation factor RimP [Candidatus Lariskella endosymbiont of Hedychridium roseum]|uniref:ribosome maturation factor RimP n=1 Tax=Candidatus Lariskella endosymbiont of Hedychridium roseum TaxID=3077949 RepID=UPI0030D5AAD5
MLVFKTQLEREVLELLESSMEAMGYCALRVRINQGKKSKTLQLMIERMDSTQVSVEDCEKVSKQASVLLDLHEPMRDRYYLEVSSPGIDRPLTRYEDFSTYEGNNVKIILNHPIDNQRKFLGKLCGLKGDNVLLQQQSVSVELIEIPVSNISEANVESNMLRKVILNRSRGRNATK